MRTRFIGVYGYCFLYSNDDMAIFLKVVIGFFLFLVLALFILAYLGPVPAQNDRFTQSFILLSLR